MAIDNVSASGVLDQLNRRDKKDEKDKDAGGNDLGRDAFLKLMITQMENQNPLEPQKNSEFVAQLAQFSSVEGLQNLNDTVDGLAGTFQSSRALQASSLVGRAVKVPGDTGYLNEGGAVAGSIDVPASTSGVALKAFNTDGELVWERGLGPQEAGELSFLWDGKLSDGTTLAPGEYRFEASGTVDGDTEEFATYMAANVNSVTLGKNDAMTLNVAGVGPVPLSEVKEIL